MIPNIATSRSLITLKQRLIDLTSLRLSKSFYSRSVQFKRTNSFFFPRSFGSQNLRDQITIQVSCLFFSILYLSYHYKFSFGAQNLPFISECRHVI